MEEALDGWEEKALREREMGFAGDEQMGILLKWLGIWGQKLEDIAMAVKDDKWWQLLGLTKKDMLIAHLTKSDHFWESSHFYASYRPCVWIEEKRRHGKIFGTI